MWTTTAVFSVVAIVMTSFGLRTALVFALLTIPLVARGSVVALSGLLTGFGACWSLLTTRQWASGGTSDNGQFWMAVGIAPLVVGCALLALRLAPRVPRPR
jgi:hypothetical protein